MDDARAVEQEADWTAELDAFENLNITADQPVAAVEDELDAVMTIIKGAELAQCALTLAMRVDLDVLDDGDHLAVVE